MTRGELERLVEQFREASHKAGLRLTHQRLEIFREVASSGEHPDAETVFNGVLQRLPTISLDTVYRTLWMLTDLGLLTTLGPRREKTRFDANLAPHHHFVCTNCRAARDFEDLEFEPKVPAPVRAFGLVLSTHVEMRGLCTSCAGRLSTAGVQGAA